MIVKKNGSSILNVYFEQGKQENSSIIYIYSYIYIYVYSMYIAFHQSNIAILRPQQKCQKYHYIISWAKTQFSMVLGDL